MDPNRWSSNTNEANDQRMTKLEEALLAITEQFKELRTRLKDRPPPLEEDDTMGTEHGDSSMTHFYSNSSNSPSQNTSRTNYRPPTYYPPSNRTSTLKATAFTPPPLPLPPPPLPTQPPSNRPQHPPTNVIDPYKPSVNRTMDHRPPILPTPPSQSTQPFSPSHSLQSITQFQSPHQFLSTHQLHNPQPLHPIPPSQTSPPTNIISSDHTYPPSLQPKILSNSYQTPLSSPTPPPPLVPQPTPKSKYPPLPLLILTTIQMAEKHTQMIMLIGTIEYYDDPDITYNGRASNPGDYG